MEILLVLYLVISVIVLLKGAADSNYRVDVNIFCFLVPAYYVGYYGAKILTYDLREIVDKYRQIW